MHRRDQLRPVVGVVLEVGVLDEHVVAGREREPGAHRGALPAIAFVHEDANRAVAELAQHVAGAVGAAVVDDDDLALDAVGELDRAHAPHHLHHGVALVVDGHDDRELADLRRRACHARPRVRSSRYQACMRSRPSRSSIFGSHCSSSRARVMSGRRRVGSPIGQRLEHELRRRARDLAHERRELEHRELDRDCRC